MGLAEKALLTSLKAQLSALKKQADNPGLDDETRARMTESRDYVQAQIDVLENGGSAADLASVPQPVSWGGEASAAAAVADSEDAVVSVGVRPALRQTDASASGSKSIPAGTRRWLGLGILAFVVVSVVVVGLIWAFGGSQGLGVIATDTGCEVWTAEGGWTHYPADHPACEDAGDD
ncbi:MAG: hypothetical protein IT192_01105 [Microbacteriaceae bacterium]|nr:hypothetical protein [Microbacteriaceae bacterium]